jgi:hypothetical protein
MVTKEIVSMEAKEMTSGRFLKLQSTHKEGFMFYKFKTKIRGSLGKSPKIM